MKKFLWINVILCCCVVLLCGCTNNVIVGDNANTPSAAMYKNYTFLDVPTKTFVVYVDGAVQNPGYYVVKQGETFANLLDRAGVLRQTYMPTNYYEIIKSNQSVLVKYTAYSVAYDVINVNGLQIANNLLQDTNIDSTIVAKLHDYVVNVGKITNKQILKDLLTEQEYRDCHYKLYVAQEDYQKGD